MIRGATWPGPRSRRVKLTPAISPQKAPRRTKNRGNDLGSLHSVHKQQSRRSRQEWSS